MQVSSIKHFLVDFSYAVTNGNGRSAACITLLIRNDYINSSFKNTSQFPSAEVAICLSYNPLNPLPGIYLQNVKINNQQFKLYKGTSSSNNNLTRWDTFTFLPVVQLGSASNFIVTAFTDVLNDKDYISSNSSIASAQVGFYFYDQVSSY